MKKVRRRPANQTRRRAKARQPDRVLIPFTVRSPIQQTSQRIQGFQSEANRGSGAEHAIN